MTIVSPWRACSIAHFTAAREFSDPSIPTAMRCFGCFDIRQGYDDAANDARGKSTYFDESVLAKEHEVMLRHDLIEGDARDTLNIPNIDLLVIGARGHSGIAGILLGSVADYITRHATVPVVVIPPESRTTAK